MSSCFRAPVEAHEEEPSNIDRRLMSSRVPRFVEPLLFRAKCPKIGSTLMGSRVGGSSRIKGRREGVGGVGSVEAVRACRGWSSRMS